MDPEETDEITQYGVTSLQQSTLVQLEDRMETDSVGNQAVSAASERSRITTSLPSPDGDDDDINTSEPTFASVPENEATYHWSPKIIPQIHISIPLENSTTALRETAAMEEKVTSGNNHVSTSTEGSKSTSEDATVVTWESSATSMEVALNDPGDDSFTVSGHVSTKAHHISLSSGENATSVTEQANGGGISLFSSSITATTRTITTVDTFSKAPKNTSVDENSRGTTMSTAPEISVFFTVVRGDSCDTSTPWEAASASTGSRDIPSGENEHGLFIGDTCSPLCAENISATAATPGSTMDIMGTKDPQENTSYEDSAPQDKDPAIFPGVFTNNASPVLDPEEISHKVLKGTPSYAADSTPFLPDSGCDSLFSAEDSVLDVTCSAAFQLPSAVISGCIASLSSVDNSAAMEGTYTLTGSGGSPASESRMDVTIIDSCSSSSAPTTVASANMCNASADDNVYTLGSIANTVSLGNPRYTATTGSGSPAIISGENTTTSIPDEHIATFGNLSTIATVNKPFPVTSHNASIMVCSGGVAPDGIKNMASAIEEMPTTATVENTSKHNLYGRSATLLSSGAIRETNILREEAINVSENDTITPSSINVLRYTHAMEHSVSGDNITREDAIAAVPESDNLKKLLSASGTEIISGEMHRSVKKTFGDTVAISSSKESSVDSTPVRTKTIATQENTSTNMVANITTNYGSAVDSEDLVSTGEEKSTDLRLKTTIKGDGVNAIPGNDTEIAGRETSHSLFDETITGQFTVDLGNTTISHRNVGTTIVPHTNLTNSTVTESAKEASTKTTDSISENSNICAETEATSTPWSTGGTTSEEDIATTDSGDVTKSTTSRETAPINFENDVVTEATTTGVENTVVISSPGTSTILGHPKSSFSTVTSTQEGNTDQMETTTALGYIPNSSEGAHHGETITSAYRKIPITTNVQETNFSQRSSKECTTSEAMAPSGRSPMEDASSPSWSDISMTSMDVETKDDGSHRDTESFDKTVTPEASVASATFRTSDMVSTSDDATNTIGSGDIYATGHTTARTTSVDMDGSPVNNSRRPPTASGDLSRNPVLLGDALTVAPIATEATSVVTAMSTQAFSGDIITVFQDKSANSPRDSPELTEIIAPEDTSALSATVGDSQMVTHSEGLTPETRSPAETHILGNPCLVSNITPKEMPNSSHPMTPTDTPATTSITCTLNDAISTPGNATPVFEIISSDGMLSSANDPAATSLDVSIQNQATSPEISTAASGNLVPSSGEIVTTVTTTEVQTVTGEVTLANSLEGRVTHNVNIISNHETLPNLHDPCIDHRDLSDATSLSSDTNISHLVLGETVPSSETFSSGNAIHMATPLGEGNVRPASCSPAEAFSTLASALNGHKGHTETPSQSINSAIGDTSQKPETNIAFGNSINPILSVEDDELSTAADSSSPSATTDKSAVCTGASEHIPSTLEEADSPGDSMAELSGVKHMFITTTLSGAVIVPGENTTDIPALNMTTGLGDIHASTVAASGDVRDTNSVFEDTSSIQYEATARMHRKFCEEAQTSESRNLPVVHLTPRGSFGTNVDKAVVNTEEAPADLINHVNDAITVNTGNFTPSYGDVVSVSEDFTITGGIHNSSKVTRSITEDSRQEETSASEETISLAEMPITGLNSMTEMNRTDTEVLHTIPEPSIFQEDATLIPTGVSVLAVTLSGDTAISHSERTSLGKPTDLSLSSTISSTDSIPATLPHSRKIVSAASHVMSDASSEDTLKETSILEVASACSSAATSPLEETPDVTTVPEDTNLGISTDDTEEAPSSKTNIVLRKYPSSEATTVLEEVTFSGSITETRESFAPTEFIETSVPQFASDSSLIVTTDSTMSLEGDTFTSCSGSKSDETHTSGTVITIDVQGKTLGPGASTAPTGDPTFEDSLIVASEHRNIIQDDNEHPILPENTDIYPNTTEDATYAPEISSTADPEDVSGSRNIVPEDAISTTLDKLNDPLAEEISSTTERALATDSGEGLTAKHKETNKKSQASVLSETKIVSGEAYINTPVEETTTVTLRETLDMDVETPMLSGEISEVPSVDTNFGKTVEPTSIRSPVAPREIAAISPKKTPATATFEDNIDNTKDACEHTFTVPEELLIEDPRKIDITQSGNISESSIGTDEIPTVIHRRPSTTFPSQVPLMSASGVAVLPSEVCLKASAIPEESFPDVPKDNVLIAQNSEKTPATAPKEAAFSFQRKCSTIRQGKLNSIHPSI
ncbi:uncharacterized protein LOC144587589 [Pogona vitticeps]